MRVWSLRTALPSTSSISKRARLTLSCGLFVLEAAHFRLLEAKAQRGRQPFTSVTRLVYNFLSCHNTICIMLAVDYCSYSFSPEHTNSRKGIFHPLRFRGIRLLHLWLDHSTVLCAREPRNKSLKLAKGM